MNRNFSVTRKLAVTGLFALAAATVIGGRPAQAQQTEVEALRAQIEELTSRLERLEQAKITSDDAAKASPNVTSKQPIQVTGLLQVRGEAFLNQDVSTPNLRASDTFRIRRGEIRLTAPAITPRISGTIMFDLARGLYSNASSTAASASFGANAFQELQLSYLLKKAPTGSTNNIYIDAGQFKVPLGYEGDLVGSGATQTIDRALIFTARDPFGGGYGDVRDTGIQLRGTFGEQWDYRLAAFNGLGERQNQLATSDTKALVARLAYRPTSVPGLIVGVSAATGNTRTSTNFTAPRADRDAFNVFGAYKKDQWTFQAEYLKGDAEGYAGAGAPPGATSIRKIEGYYGSVGYLFTPKLEGVFRYDFLDTDTNLSDADVRDLILGLNYYIKGNNAKIQANIIRRNGGANATFNTPSAGNPTVNYRDDSTQLRVQGQVAF